MGEHRHLKDGVQKAKVSWREPDKREWGGSAPEVLLEYDEANHWLLKMEITYSRRKAKRAMAFNAGELRAKMQQQLETAGVFVKASETSSGGTTGGSSLSY